MPPKPKFKREEILQKAVALVRKQGAERLTARDLAAALGTSARPIFTAFQNMEELRDAVICEGWRVYYAYREKELKEEKYPPFKAMGMAYIRFAAEEKNLFKLLFMQDRGSESNERAAADVEEACRAAGIAREKAEIFHLEIWSAVHGFAVMLATGYCRLDMDRIAAMLTDLFMGLKHCHGGEMI